MVGPRSAARARERQNAGVVDVSTEKRAWRARARAERDGLVPDHAATCKVLADFLDRRVARMLRVVVYDAMADELDLAPLIATDPDPATRFAVTRTPDEGHVLSLHPYGGPTERHPYGYRQPRFDAPTVADHEVGAVLVPGLAFARDGARLGRGKGYYDRFLARLGPGALLIGMTAGYVVDRLPVDVHDVRMTHLCLDDEVVAAASPPPS